MWFRKALHRPALSGRFILEAHKIFFLGAMCTSAGCVPQPDRNISIMSKIHNGDLYVQSIDLLKRNGFDCVISPSLSNLSDCSKLVQGKNRIDTCVLRVKFDEIDGKVQHSFVESPACIGTP